MTSNTYQINLNINTPTDLQTAGYNLCVAIAVNTAFNVVYTGNFSYNKINNFWFNDQCKVFATEAFPSKNLSEVAAVDTSDNIQSGKSVPFSTKEKFGGVTTYQPQLIVVNNKYQDEIHFGLQVQAGIDPFNLSYTPIYLVKKPAEATQCSYQLLTPSPTDKQQFVPQVLVWFDKARKTGDIIDSTVTNVYSASLLPPTNNKSQLIVNYTVFDNQDPGEGIWAGPDGSPLQKRDYDPLTNTFKVDESKFVDKEVIQLWNQKVEEGFAWN